MSSGQFLGNLFSFGFDPEEHYWNVLGREISDALTESGVDCAYLPFAELATDEGMQRFFDDGKKFVIAYNLTPSFELPVEGRKVSSFDLVKKTVICPLFDHPAYHVRFLQSHDQLSSFHFGTMDPDHDAYLHEIGVVDSKLFDFRHAGPRIDTLPKPIAERSIDILFSGTVRPPKTGAEILAEQPHLLGISVAEIERCLELVVEEQETPNETVSTLNQSRGGSLDLQKRTGLIRAIDTAARGHLRYKLLSVFPEEHMTFIGNHSEEFKARMPESRFIGLSSFVEVRRLMADSKITISDTINLRNAGLFRHFYANAAGSAVATNPNSYFQNEFVDDESVIFCPLNNPDNAERLRALLNDPKKLTQIAEGGFELQQAGHTWHDRVGGIVDIFE